MFKFDNVLNLPKGIDIYIYSPGSGGEFFTSLISLSHEKTRGLFKNTSFKILNDAPDENLVRYRRASHFKINNETFDPFYKIDFEFCFDSFYWMGHQLNGIEKIHFIKTLLFQCMISYNYNINKRFKIKPRLGLKNTFSDTFIILCTHWVNFDPAYKIKNMESKTFGIPLFENEKYWNVINLDPQTEKGVNLVKNFCKKYDLIQNPDDEINRRINHQAFNNIKLKFPFMDYMACNNLNSIKDYIENRYGPNLDFDFIDQALINYKKLRVDPYL